MRRPALALALALACSGSGALGDAPTPVIVHNYGLGTTRVQIAVGDTLPCDSSDNKLVFDGVLRPGDTRALAVALGTVKVCARSTAPGTRLDWMPSQWRYGGVRCMGPRRRRCQADATVPIRVDLGG